MAVFMKERKPPFLAAGFLAVVSESTILPTLATSLACYSSGVPVVPAAAYLLSSSASALSADEAFARASATL